MLLAHEIGHSLGLDHSQDPKNIMYFAAVEDAKVLEEDCQLLNNPKFIYKD